MVWDCISDISVLSKVMEISTHVLPSDVDSPCNMIWKVFDCHGFILNITETKNTLLVQ